MEELKEGKISEFNVYSEDVREVLSTTPSSLFYTGNTIIALVVLFLLFLSWLIKFPDVIATDAHLISEATPIKLVAKTNGNLSKLFINDGDWIEKDSVIAIMLNNENIKDIELLKGLLEKIKRNISNDKILSLDMPSNLRIGDFTLQYAQIKSLHYNLAIVTNELSVASEDEKILLQLSDTKKMKATLIEEQDLILKQITTKEKNQQRQKQLHSEGIVSLYDVEQSEYELTTILNEEKRLKYRIADIDATIKSLLRQQTALNTSDKRNLSEIRLEINSLVEQLISQIKIWEHKHIIKAPFSGACSFITHLSENQHISENTGLIYISPDFNEIKVRGTLPIEKSGLVSKGQNVILKLKPYPHKEYGALTATMDHISYMANEDGYVYFAKLDSQLITNYGKKIKFKPQMQADAEIIVEDSRLIERIFNEIKNIFAN